MYTRKPLPNDKRLMYELIDFGRGRKLERFAGQLLDRPCPGSESLERANQHWPRRRARFAVDGNRNGSWTCPEPINEPWVFRTPFGSLELALSPFGHTGVFPEQRDHWDWILAHRNTLTGKRLLNLFAYTGGSTLAGLTAGAAVTHVDSARNIVNRARRNALASGLADRPVRWIVEDATTFVQREARRGSRYDGLILDPPTYGHGTRKSQTWDLKRDFPRLLEMLRELVPDPQLVLCTCHTNGVATRDLLSWMESAFSVPPTALAGNMELIDAAGRSLPSGVHVRWATHEENHQRREPAA